MIVSDVEMIDKEEDNYKYHHAESLKLKRRYVVKKITKEFSLCLFVQERNLFMN